MKTRLTFQFYSFANDPKKPLSSSWVFFISLWWIRIISAYPHRCIDYLPLFVWKCPPQYQGSIYELRSRRLCLLTSMTMFRRGLFQGKEQNSHQEMNQGLEEQVCFPQHELSQPIYTLFFLKKVFFPIRHNSPISGRSRSEPTTAGSSFIPLWGDRPFLSEDSNRSKYL